VAMIGLTKKVVWKAVFTTVLNVVNVLYCKNKCVFLKIFRTDY